MAQEQRHVDARLALAVNVHADTGVAKPGPASAKPHVRERACTLVLEKHGFVTGNELAFLADRGEELHRRGPGCSGRPVAFRSTRRCFASGSGGSADEEYVTDRRRQSPARADDHQQRVRRMFGLFDEMRCRSMRKHSREATESTPDGAWLPPISTCTVRVDKTQREDLTGAWFNFRISEGDGSWVAGVKLATASDPPVAQSSDLRASPFGRQPQPPPSYHLRLNRALTANCFSGTARSARSQRTECQGVSHARRLKKHKSNRAIRPPRRNRDRRHCRAALGGGRMDCVPGHDVVSEGRAPWRGRYLAAGIHAGWDGFCDGRGRRRHALGHSDGPGAAFWAQTDGSHSGMAAFTRDGSTFAAIDFYGPGSPMAITLRDASDGRVRWRLPMPNEGAYAILFTAGGKQVRTVVGVRNSNTGELVDVDAASGREVSRRSFSLVSRTVGTAVSPDGQLMAWPSGTAVILWNLETDSEHAAPVISSTGPTVSCTGFSPDGSTLAIGLSNGSIEIWELPALKHRATVACHKLGVRSVGLQLSRDGRTLTSRGQFSGANSLLGAILDSVGRAIRAGAAAREEVVVVDVFTGERLGVVPSAVHPFLSPDGGTLVVRDSSFAVELYDIPVRSPRDRRGKLGRNLAASGIEKEQRSDTRRENAVLK